MTNTYCTCSNEQHTYIYHKTYHKHVSYSLHGITEQGRRHFLGAVVECVNNESGAQLGQLWDQGCNRTDACMYANRRTNGRRNEPTECPGSWGAPSKHLIKPSPFLIIQLTAGLKGLVRPVSAVVLGIAHVVGGYAATVGALELPRAAGLLGASLRVLVAAVGAVAHTVAVPGHRDAELVLTLELVLLAAVVTWKGERREFGLGSGEFLKARPDPNPPDLSLNLTWVLRGKSFLWSQACDQNVNLQLIPAVFYGIWKPNWNRNRDI